MTTTHCTGHSRCPKCQRTGHDRTGDNLALYSDGSKYCFRCGYVETASGIQKLQTASEQHVGTTDRQIALPRDVDSGLPEYGRRWLGNFALTDNDIKTNMIMWSEYYKRLVFPYFQNGELLGWQGRYIGDDPKASKWFTQGDIKGSGYRVGNKLSRTCVIVEDIISAIKVGHDPRVCAIPLFGSHISLSMVLRLKQNCSKLILWLDGDMNLKSSKYANTARLVGLDCVTIFTKKDPKEYTDTEVSNHLIQHLTD